MEVAVNMGSEGVVVEVEFGDNKEEEDVEAWESSRIQIYQTPPQKRPSIFVNTENRKKERKKNHVP